MFAIKSGGRAAIATLISALLLIAVLISPAYAVSLLIGLVVCSFFASVIHRTLSNLAEKRSGVVTSAVFVLAWGSFLIYAIGALQSTGSEPGATLSVGLYGIIASLFVAAIAARWPIATGFSRHREDEARIVRRSSKP